MRAKHTIFKVRSLAAINVVAMHTVVTKKLAPALDGVVNHLEIDCGTIRHTVVSEIGEALLRIEIHAFIARCALVLLNCL